MNLYFTQYLPYLPTIAIPIIIYLLFRKQFNIKDFSSLYIFEKVLKKEKRRVKLLEILLLIVRTLLIAFILLFFLSPFFGEQSYNKDLPTKSYLYIDNSKSVIDSGSLESYKNSAKSIIERLGEGKIYIRENEQLRTFSDKKEAFRFIENIALSFNQISIDRIESEIDSLLTISKDINREIFLFSDGLLGSSKKDINYHTLLPQNETSQVFIDTLLTSVDDGVLSFDIRIKNIGKEVKNSSIALSINGKKAGSKQLPTFKGEISTRFTHNNLQNLSHIHGVVEYKDRELSDRKIFSIVESSTTDILIVGEQTGVNPIMSGVAALGANGITVENSSYKNFLNNNLNQYEIIIIEDALRLDSYSIERFSKVNDPIKLIFYGEMEQLNIGKAIEKYLPFKTDSIIKDIKGKIDWIDRDSYLFKDVFKERKVIESSTINQMVEVNISGIETIVKVDNRPLLLKDIKRDHFFVTTSLDPLWSNLATNGILVPILDNLIKKGRERNRNLTPWYYSGGNITIDNGTITTPEGGKVKHPGGNFTLFDNQKGFYKDHKGKLYGVNPYPDYRFTRNRDLLYIDKDQFKQYLKKFNYSSYELHIIILILLLILFEFMLSKGKK
jgi:hypothetical protein